MSKHLVTIPSIAEKLDSVEQGLSGTEFLWSFLECFQGKGSEIAKATLTRLKKGTGNIASDPENDCLVKLKLFFTWCSDPQKAILETRADSKLMGNKPKWIIATNGDRICAFDVVTQEPLDVLISESMEIAEFFLPLAGLKKLRVDKAIEVDVKATRNMGKLFDEIRKHNKETTSHQLNVFLARLLFCYYAEDTGIFKKDIFTNSIGSHTKEDGSDLQGYLEKLFTRLDQRGDGSYPELKDFPYVNGSLFSEQSAIPFFSKKARRLLIENGEQDWQNINPDIFGSMFQVVIDPALRHELGAHYTSRENIMKVINPLFLDELAEELEKSRSSEKKLKALHQRIREIRIFDPACGSGNFLILAYGELRDLEMEIYEAMEAVTGHREALPMISLNNFYGIEIEDFARELAVLSMWIKEHQCNLQFQEHFGALPPTLPLKAGAQVALGNSTTKPWIEACPKLDSKGNELEIYILGNPPYLGSSMQNKEQKADLETVAKRYGIGKYKNLDYISCWFFNASHYLNGATKVKAAFVSTNSISQGDHASLLWGPILDEGIAEIEFVHPSFKWKNSALNNAGVTCVVVGLSNCGATKVKTIYADEGVQKVATINEYLYSGPYLGVGRRNGSVSGLPSMMFGNKPTDGGYLNMTIDEANEIISDYPEANKFIRYYVGAKDFIDKNPRKCLWIEDHEVTEARAISPINDRLNKINLYRAGEGPDKKGKPTKTVSDISKEFASKPHRFLQRPHQAGESLIFPSTTSEKRDYIPLGFLDDSTVISNAAQVVYNAEAWTFGVLTSKMHMCWIKLVAGRLEERIRYSSFVYNNFPCPPISDEVKEELEDAVFEIIDAREAYPEKTYGELYDPDKMPAELLAAHQKVDAVVERIYRKKPFVDDQERTQHLVDLYLKMTANE